MPVGGNFGFYLLIFIGEASYLTLSTFRVVLMGQGKRVAAVAVDLAETAIWLIITGTVISDIRSDPMKIIVYCVAFSIGILLGNVIPKHLRGYVMIQVDVAAQKAEILAGKLHDRGFGVTILEGNCEKRESHNIVFTELNRSRLGEAKRIIMDNAPEALIAVHDMGYVSGGFIR